MQQPAAFQVGVFTKVEIERTVMAFGAGAQPPLLGSQVGGQGHRRGLGWDLADRIADDKATFDQGQDGVVAAPE